MAKKYPPTDFRHTAEFGTYKSVANPYTGVSVPKFVSKFKLHYKSNTRTLNQEYLAVQAGFSETRVIVIRHNMNVKEGMQARLNGELYDIIKTSPDDNFGFSNYDFLTLKKSEKVGSK
ncbi:phage head closure protein [Streptococcus gallolyticus]|uniref:Phage head-tail adaptor, putative, SPP1 family n=1 Tax=Streptococcus gallolyticus TaxID=315405 RepID=A0A1H9VJM9_9STRE|nr:phage head closure protein [Streptococcus gallolyticus]SDJ74370.1 phage head-tail adaptor, putative, SPP1 family [Streptococcus gallolyticus]SDL24752.1 phage head-tail adaptor, putative, SPP1 family [Streptococcus gallolyticus]SES21413.1 phage head-tail adaptor, putative, SPP1 family [Streptococcus gallolyticus]